MRVLSSPRSSDSKAKAGRNGARKCDFDGTDKSMAGLENGNKGHANSKTKGFPGCDVSEQACGST